MGTMGLGRWARRLRRRPDSIRAAALVDALKDGFRSLQPGAGPASERLGWVLSVPDAQQRSWLEAAGADAELASLTCASEDDAHAVAAGLWMGGETSVVSLQHAGLQASLNAIQGIGIDGRVPLFLLVGLRGRERWLDPRDSHVSRVRACEPLLDTLGVPHARLERPADLPLVPRFLRLAHERRGPTALLVGRETV